MNAPLPIKTRFKTKVNHFIRLRSNELQENNKQKTFCTSLSLFNNNDQWKLPKNEAHKFK